MNGELFDWDFDNITHIARHGVTPEDAEEVLLGQTAYLGNYFESGELRVREVGATRSGRYLEIVTTERRGRLRVVTAFVASREAVKRYVEYVG